MMLTPLILGGDSRSWENGDFISHWKMNWCSSSWGNDEFISFGFGNTIYSAATSVSWSGGSCWSSV